MELTKYLELVDLQQQKSYTCRSLLGSLFQFTSSNKSLTRVVVPQIHCFSSPPATKVLHASWSHRFTVLVHLQQQKSYTRRGPIDSLFQVTSSNKSLTRVVVPQIHCFSSPPATKVLHASWSHRFTVLGHLQQQKSYTCCGPIDSLFQFIHNNKSLTRVMVLQIHCFRSPTAIKVLHVLWSHRFTVLVHPQQQKSYTRRGPIDSLFQVTYSNKSLTCVVVPQIHCFSSSTVTKVLHVLWSHRFTVLVHPQQQKSYTRHGPIDSLFQVTYSHKSLTCVVVPQIHCFSSSTATKVLHVL